MKYRQRRKYNEREEEGSTNYKRYLFIFIKKTFCSKFKKKKKNLIQLDLKLLRVLDQHNFVMRTGIANSIYSLSWIS